METQMEAEPPPDFLPEITLDDPRGGRRGQGPPPVCVARSLTEADLPALRARASPLVPAAMPKLKQLRHAHHQLARLLAMGTDQNEVALITGYSPAYISSIKKDPQFQDLMATYQGERQLAFVDLLERMKALGLTCLEELQSRLAEEPERWSKRELMELAELVLVKTGRNPGPLGPGSAVDQTRASVAINVKFVQAQGAPSGPTSEPGPVFDLVAKKIEPAN